MAKTTLFDLAVAIQDTAKKADEAWPERRCAMSILIDEAATVCCKNEAESHLVNLLLIACWNDALDWANTQVRD